MTEQHSTIHGSLSKPTNNPNSMISERSQILSASSKLVSVIDHGIFNLLNSGVVIIDQLGVIVFINDSAENYLGIASMQVLGKYIDDLPLKSFAYKVLSENSHEEAVHLSGGGKYLWVRSKILKDDSGCYDVIEIQDKSEERKLMRGREESVAMMTHDLKSPLTVMMGYIQALSSNPSEKLLKACIEELERGSRRLLSMIEDTLDAYRMEVGLIESRRGACPVGDLLLEVCCEFNHEATQHGIELKYDIPEKLPTIYADSRQLSRVLSNLISNAVKFTPAGGEIYVKGLLEGDAVIITVEDTGIGIPEDEIDKIFRKYYRSSKSRGYKGSGLGLAISKAFVEAHGGHIEAESKDKTGTLFRISLPLVADDTEFNDSENIDQD